MNSLYFLHHIKKSEGEHGGMGKCGGEGSSEGEHGGEGALNYPNLRFVLIY